MLRIASACTSVSLKRCISTGFGSSSSRMMRITSSRLRIGDEIAVEHLEPVAISASRMPRAAQQHLAAVVEPSPQHLAEAHDPRHPARDRTFMLSGMRVSRSVARNSDSISSAASTVRLFGSRTMRTSSADSSRTSASSGSFFASSSSAIFSISRRLLHLIGNLGDDDLIGAAAVLLDLPAGAHPEGAAAGAIGLEDASAASRR